MQTWCWMRLFFSSGRRHTRCLSDWSSDVCSSDLPWRVFTVGLPTLDLARQKVFAQPAELVAQFKFDLARPVILFCQHPIATEPGKTLEQIQPSLEALVEFAGEGGQVLVTYPNNDAGCEIIIGEIKRFAGLG